MYYRFPRIRELAFTLPPLLFFREKALRVLEAHLPSSPPPRTVLDVGCATGLTTRRLARRYPRARILGVDLSAAMIREARARTDFPGVSFQVADVLEIRESFDLVVAFFVWMLLPPGSLAHLHDLLEPGGKALLLLTSPTWFTRWHRWFFERAGGGTLMLWPSWEWEEEARRVGLLPRVYPAHAVEGSFLLELRRGGGEEG